MTPEIYSTEEFEKKYTYLGTDLGATYDKKATFFRVWAPTAKQVWLRLYRSGNPGADDLLEQIPMTADFQGTWIARKEGDLNGVYYTYLADLGDRLNEACDPYARATGVNGQRAMVIDLSATDPAGWNEDADPHWGDHVTDAIIYELHVRDLSMDESSGIQNKGKFLGLIETGTKNSAGQSTGLDHIKNLGITHLHLLPSYDYGSVDETCLDTPQFNWGYDPVNYNVPEGSYSSDPYHGAIRVAEMKQMIKGLHDNGISVVLDVVYNHVYDGGSFCFNRLVPEYFSRTDGKGRYSNASGCGNDTASERSMVRKYIVDSIRYWAEEYHIDGFRFDLVGLLDVQTINELVEVVHMEHPNVIFYGEGWSMDSQLTKPGISMATQANSHMTPSFAYFSDTLRDTLRGSVFVDTAPGFISGVPGLEQTLARCFLGQPGWCQSPSQTVNYASCHDNMALFDRITLSAPWATREDRIRMNKLAAAIYLTCQGIPFLQAGEEFLRSKPLPAGGFDHNSYRSPDSVNSIKWNELEKEDCQNVLSYYRGLIAFRKAHPVLRLTTAAEVNSHILPVKGLQPGLAAFLLDGRVPEESCDAMLVIFNGGKQAADITLPMGKWKVCIDNRNAGNDTLYMAEQSVCVPAFSAMVLCIDRDPKKRKSGRKVSVRHVQTK